MPLAKRLARRFAVHVVGYRGDRGTAASLSGATQPSDYAEDLVEVLDQIGLERPPVLGLSFGAAVALEAACAVPGRIGPLVLFGADSRFRPSLGSTIASRVLERYPLPVDNRFLNQFFNVLHGTRPDPGPLVDFVVERCWETDQGVVASRLRGLEHYDVGDRLWRVDSPTLIVAGDRDVVSPPARQRALADAIAGARVATLPGAGHIGFLTHRDEVARLLVEHVRDLRPTAH